LKGRSQPNFACESLRTEAGGDITAQNLDDYVAAECGLMGQEDARHSAAAELTIDGVRISKCGLQTVAKLHPPDSECESPKLCP
jgi:hypothetical protein